MRNETAKCHSLSDTWLLGEGRISFLGRAGGRMRSLQELSPREREIALLVCEGLSNAEIARQLRKSVLTIKTQLNAVFRKLGVTSRTRLMAMLR